MTNPYEGSGTTPEQVPGYPTLPPLGESAGQGSPSPWLPTPPAASEPVAPPPIPAQPAPFQPVAASPVQPLPVPSPPPAAPLGAPLPPPPGVMVDPSHMPYPMSAPPVPYPMSAPPVSGAYGYPPFSVPLMAPAKPRGRVALILVSVVAALFVGATAVTTTLLIQKTSDNDKLTAQVHDRDASLAQRDTTISTLQKDLDSTKTRADDADAAHKAVADCLNALYAVWDAQDSKQPQAKIDSLISAYRTACRAADPYL
jgi:hypothetical protein